MALRRLTIFVLLAVLCGTASLRASATVAARTWSVTPTDDVQPGDPLMFTGSGCAKRGVPASHFEIVIDTNFGLLGYVPVAANGTWRLTSRISPSPGQFLMVLHASCFDDGGHVATAGAKLVFRYPQVLAVRYAGGLALRVFPLREVEDKPLDSKPVAFFTYPSASGAVTPPSQFVATVNWADGSAPTSSTDSTSPQVKVVAGPLGYEVLGSHTYSAPRSGRFFVGVRLRTSKKPSLGTAPLVVDPVHPRAAFDVNPSNPQKYGIALLMPHEAEHWQYPIDQWSWKFTNEDYNQVFDNHHNHQLIADAVEKLIASPGDSQVRNRGITLGILPRCVDDLIGCLDNNDIRRLALVWREYWPRDVVPHLFMKTGHPSITLTVSDKPPSPSQPPRTSTTTHVVDVTPDCRPWGGPLTKYFGGYTTCDTFNGIKTQFGDHRVADYVSIGASKDAISLNKLAGGGGVAIVITRGVVDNAAGSVFLAVHLEAGVGAPVGLPYGGGVTEGWLGPPDLAHHPSGDEINSFAGGSTISAGFNLGLIGWHAIESPTSGQVGEELFHGLTGVSADAGISCAWPLPQLGSSAPGKMRNILKLTEKEPSADDINQAKSLLAGALAGINLAVPGVNAILACLGV